MLNAPVAIKKSLFGVLFGVALTGGAGSALAITPFQQDVATAIDRGLAYQSSVGAYNTSAYSGDAAGIAMLALLEKRVSGNPADPPQGYSGASAADQATLRASATSIINAVNTEGTYFFAYSNGSRLFALVSYALTGGPDKSVLGTSITLKQAIDRLADNALANQAVSDSGLYVRKGMWGYSGPGADSSTTQFVAAGLYAAQTFYKSAKVGDGDVAFADPVRLAKVDNALLLARQHYASEGGAGSDNSSCNVLTASERGHGYYPNSAGYVPSMQQTASGIYIQLFGGANVNDAGVQPYMEWTRNRYRWLNLDSMGNYWPNESWSYYLWSSFKAMELIRQSGITPTGTNIGPDALGTLPAANAPACNQRQSNKNPATVSRPAVFGVGGPGYYNGEPAGQYFDYAHQLLSVQCGNGSFFCNGNPGAWETNSHNAYALLVLQRATGVVVARCDVDGDSVVDRDDIKLIQAAIGTRVGANDVRDADSNGLITVTDIRQCTLKCTKAKCAP
jgi:hypothetical protein